jgi:hypothetical protein
VVLLRHIRDVFDARGVDRLFSRVLVQALNEIDDAPWSEWRGVRDDQQPRRLSQGELARLLRPFRIRPRTVWPMRTTSAKGYYRHQFEQAWRNYCDGQAADGTPSQPSRTVLGRGRRRGAIWSPAILRTTRSSSALPRS